MALSLADNDKVRKRVQRFYGTANITKADFREAIDAIDDWITDTTAKSGGVSNQAHFLTYLASNASAFSTNTDANQKELAFGLVMFFRAGLIDNLGV